MSKTKEVGTINFTSRGEKLQDRKIIKCPYCSYEYLPGEIFIPINVIGRPKKEIRDPLGKILYEDYEEGKEPIAEEKYICDGCNKTFNISLDINYKVTVPSVETNFDTLTTNLW